MRRVFFGRDRRRFILTDVCKLTANEAEITLDLKEELKRKGWVQRKAAAALGVTYVHLNYVCNGKRQSQRLTQRIMSLPMALNKNIRTNMTK